MKKLILISLLLIALALPAIGLADHSGVPHSSTIVDSAEDVERTLENIGDWMFRIFMIIAVIMIVIAAFQFLFAGGDTDKFSNAKRSLVYAIVAVAVAVLSSGIVRVVETIIKETAK
ncbi:MAG: TrbC/VirB2 family protein [Candidatus Harrisonbacteria bacterium]|nr:TrbC/VirB2 family protein [Candidatus Harrisonbacteria bacterium]